MIRALLSFSPIALAAISLTLLTACPQADTEELDGLLEDWPSEAALPLTLLSTKTIAKVTAGNSEDRCRQVAEEAAFLHIDDAGVIDIVKGSDSDVDSADLDALAEGIVDEGFCKQDDFIVEVQWTTDDGQDFSTLAVVADDGEARFEPILYFSGADDTPDTTPTPGSWTWNWQRSAKNGFGSTCLTVNWRVNIQTAGCFITDPAPHIEITTQGSNCWGWSQKTTSGESNYCGHYPECECSFDPSVANREDCIKWAVVTYVATGLSDVEVEAGGSGEYAGIGLEAKIKFSVSRLGSEWTFATIRNLCAMSGGANN